MNAPTISISPEEIEILFAKLKALAVDLSEPQRALLEAILKIARDITEGSPEDHQGSLNAQFDEAYQPFAAGTASLALEYAVSPPAPGIIVCGVKSSPPIIVRRPPPPPPIPDLDDND